MYVILVTTPTTISVIAIILDIIMKIATMSEKLNPPNFYCRRILEAILFRVIINASPLKHFIKRKLKYIC